MSAGDTIVVTGASGFIGSALVRRLVDQGRQVCCLVRAGSLNGALAQRLGGARLLPCRDNSLSALRQALDGVEPQVVFHLAAAGVRPPADPAETIRANVELMTHLLLALADQPPALVLYTGSCSEYGGRDEGRPFTEEDPLRPLSVYGAAKASAWLCGQALAARLAIPLVNLRLFGVIGPGEGAGRLIPYLIDRLGRGAVAEMTGGQQRRDLLYIDDVVDALCRAADCPRLLEHRVYNVCSGKTVSVRQVGRLVAELMGQPPGRLVWGARPYRDDEPMIVAGNNHRFVQTTGWQPQTSLRHAVRQMIHHAAAAAPRRRASA